MPGHMVPEREENPHWKEEWSTQQTMLEQGRVLKHLDKEYLGL